MCNVEAMGAQSSATPLLVRKRARSVERTWNSASGAAR